MKVTVRLPDESETEIEIADDSPVGRALREETLLHLSIADREVS